MVKDMMNGMFVVDGTPTTPLRRQLMPAIKKVGLMNIARDARGAMKAL